MPGESRNIFTPENTQKYVDDVLNIRIPDGKHGALIGYYDVSGRWKVQIVKKFGENWAIGAECRRDLERGIQGQIAIQGYF